MIVERDTPGTVPDLSGLDAVYEGRSVSLYRVPGPISRHPDSGRDVVTVLLGDLLAVLALLVVTVRAASDWKPKGDQRPDTAVGPAV